MTEIKIMKFIAPKVMTVNGYPAPCECTDKVTCAYCVQASLIYYEKKFQDNDATKKKIVSFIKQKGIRKVAKEIDTPASSVQYWFKTGNFPLRVLNKYAGCTNEHTNTQGA